MESYLFDRSLVDFIQKTICTSYSFSLDILQISDISFCYYFHNFLGFFILIQRDEGERDRQRERVRGRDQRYV